MFWKIAGRARALWARVVVGVIGATALAIAAGDHPLIENALPAAHAQPFAGSSSLFGYDGNQHPPARDFSKWTSVLARYDEERAHESSLCGEGECALVQWRQFLDTLKGTNSLAQLRSINEYFNRVSYRTDQDNYGLEDYWATPRELFAKGGDCEDYAIAKYLSLRALGWPPERLQIVVVQDRIRDLVHAVLIAAHGDARYLLDIEITEVIDHRRASRYAPIFAINETAWWSFSQPSAAVEHRERSGRSPSSSPSPSNDQ